MSEEDGEEQQECMQENGMFLVSGYEKLSFCSESLNLMPIRTKLSLSSTILIILLNSIMIPILVLTLLLGRNCECLSITKRVLKLQWYGIVT